MHCQTTSHTPRASFRYACGEIWNLQSDWWNQDGGVVFPHAPQRNSRWEKAADFNSVLLILPASKQD